MVCATSKVSDQPVHMRSLLRAFASRLIILSVKLLTEDHLELILSLKGVYTGSSESIHVKIPHCWKSHVAAQIIFCQITTCPYKSDPKIGPNLFALWMILLQFFERVNFYINISRKKLVPEISFMESNFRA